MEITKEQWAIAGTVGIIVVFLGWMYFSKAPLPTPSTTSSSIASSTVPAATSSASSTVPAVSSRPVTVLSPFPINTNDTIVSWNFKGAYTDNTTLINQANADSSRLTSLLGKGQYDNYDLYIGIGNDANLIGNGKGAYNAYNHSIAIYPNKGLAYVNLAHLMDELGAYHTAVDAYAKAVAVEPTVLEYHLEQLDYLTRQFPKDTALVLAAFTVANKQFGDSASILAIEAQWFESQGRYADAVKAWQTVEALSPANRTAAISAQIARDIAKE